MNEPGAARTTADDPALEELRQSWLSGDLVVVVGTGVSTAAGVPDRARLLELLLERARGRGASADSVEELSALAARGQSIEALSAARNMLGGAEFGAVIERHLDDRGLPVPEPARALAALAPRLRALLTTNLDHLLERALGGEWPALARATADLAQRRGFILKLHGTLLDRSTWVLTREDYDRAMYADPRLQGAFTALFHTCPLLFVGYELADDDLEAILGRVRAFAEDQPPRHFALVPQEGIPPSRRKRLESSGVRLIPCPDPGGPHAGPGRILRWLAASAGTGAPAPAPGAAPDPAPPTPAPARPAPRLDEGPFPGLEVFDEDRADYFFGRDAEVVELTQRLGDGPGRHRRWLQLEGASGSGKSSLARAGLVPKVRKGWLAGAPGTWSVAVLRPGASPVMNLAQALHAALAPGGWTLDRVAKALGDSETALAPLLRQHVPRGQGLLLVVDQLEEAFTLAGGERARAFDALLANALRDKDGPLYLVTTIRSDFLGRFRELPELELLLNAEASRYYVKPMGLPGLRAAIEGPAEKAGLRFSPGLPERILEDASGSEGALPLVAHVLRALWAQRQGNTLTSVAYDALGGVSGALTRSADAIIEGLGEDGRERARSLLLRLVVIGRPGRESTRRTIGRAEALEAAGGGREAEAVLARLSGGRDPDRPGGSEAPARLVVVVRGETGDRVDLVHEALLRRWSTLRQWIDEGRKTLERREDLEAAAKVWQAAGSHQDALPRGAQLAYLRSAEGGSEEARAFLAAAVAREERLRKEETEQKLSQARQRLRLLWTGVGAMAGVLALVGALATWALRERNVALQQTEVAGRQTEIAHSRELAATALAHLEADPGLSYELLQEANRRNRGDPVVADAVREWFSSGARAVYRSASPPLSVFAPDGEGLLTVDTEGRTRVWRGASPEAALLLPGYEGTLTGATFSQDGRRLLTVDATGVARVWEVAAAPQLAVVRQLTQLSGPSKLTFATFSPEGERVAIADEEGLVHVWDATSGQEVARVRGAMRSSVSVALGPHGRQIATASNDGTVRLWDTDPGRSFKLTLDGAVLGQKLQLAYSPDGRRLAAGDEDGALWLWDLDAHSAPPWPFSLSRGDHSAINVLVFSPDGDRLAIGSRNGMVRIWDFALGPRAERRELRGHPWGVTSARFSPDGHFLLTASKEDGTVRRWDVRPKDPPHDWTGSPEELRRIAVKPDDHLRLGVGQDSVIVWSDEKLGRAIAKFWVASSISDAAFGPDREHLLITSGSRTRVYACPVCASIEKLLEQGRDSGRPLSPDERRLYLGEGSSSLPTP